MNVSSRDVPRRAPSLTIMQVLLSRQPIFDRDERVVAYALHHHREGPPGPAGADARDAAEQLLVDATLRVGLERLTEGRPAFVRASRTLLLGDTLPLYEPGRLMLEIPPALVDDAAARAACVALAQRGYALALDGFTATPAATALLPFVRAVKIDVAFSSPSALAQLAATLRPFGVTLIAQHAEQRAVRTACARLGFTLFQGFRCTSAEVVASRDLPLQQLQLFTLLRDLRNPDLADTVIEEGFRRDVALSYKLLRVVNSAAVGGRGIWSIGHALRLLGREALHRWLTLLLLSAVPDAGMSGELLVTSLLRARLCERLATAAGLRPAAGPLFLVGALSLLDVLMDAPMEALVAQLDADEEVGAALVRREGFFGLVLGLVEAYEAGRWEDVATYCAYADVTPDALAEAYLEAVDWARQNAAGLVADAEPAAAEPAAAR